MNGIGSVRTQNRNCFAFVEDQKRERGPAREQRTSILKNEQGVFLGRTRKDEMVQGWLWFLELGSFLSLFSVSTTKAGRDHKKA